MDWFKAGLGVAIIMVAHHLIKNDRIGFSAESYEDLVSLINKSHVSKEDDPNIEKLLDDLKKEMKGLGTDKDLINTYQHKIATQLCR